MAGSTCDMRSPSPPTYGLITATLRSTTPKGPRFRFRDFICLCIFAFRPENLVLQLAIQAEKDTRKMQNANTRRSMCVSQAVSPIVNIQCIYNIYIYRYAEQHIYIYTLCVLHTLVRAPGHPPPNKRSSAARRKHSFPPTLSRSCPTKKAELSPTVVRDRCTTSGAPTTKPPDFEPSVAVIPENTAHSGPTNERVADCLGTK